MIGLLTKDSKDILFFSLKMSLLGATHFYYLWTLRKHTQLIEELSKKIKTVEVAKEVIED